MGRLTSSEPQEEDAVKSAAELYDWATICEHLIEALSIGWRFRSGHDPFVEMEQGGRAQFSDSGTSHHGVMDIGYLIILILKASIVLNVFCLGLNAGIADFTGLLRRPAKLSISLLAMNVIMPLFAITLAAAFPLHPAVKVTLVALAVSPVPPILPKRIFMAGGEASYAIGLLTSAALLAIAFVPLAVFLLAEATAAPVRISSVTVANLVMITVLAPIGAGMAIRRFAPATADKLAGPLSAFAITLLAAGILPVLFRAWPLIVSLIGDGTIAALAAFVIVGIAVGDLLGGPHPEDRVVLALSTASRHPGIAIAIVGAGFPAPKEAQAIVLLYLLVSAAVSIPYIVWSRRRRHTAA